MPADAEHPLFCPRCKRPYEAERSVCPCDGAQLIAAPASLPRPGNVFDSRFVLLELIGTGGMAKIYRGFDAVNRTQCAVKVLRVKYSAEERAVSQFFNEARIARRLHHPNIVRIIDFGRTDVGYLYIAMELLEGETLARIIRREGLLQPARAVRIFSQVAAALAAAHAQGTIHRDLKPENIFISKLGEQESAKLLDFGIAQFCGVSPSPNARDVCGTPAYMSPEQIRGREALPESDLYSAGIVLFEMLTGRPPFSGTSPVDILRKQIKSPVPRLTEASEGLAVSKELEDLVFRLMQKKAENRHRSASRVRTMLVRIPEHTPDALVSADSASAGASIMLVPHGDHSIDLPVVSYARPGGEGEGPVSKARILPAASIELDEYLESHVRPGILMEEEKAAGAEGQALPRHCGRTGGATGWSEGAEPPFASGLGPVADRYSMIHVRFVPLDELYDQSQAEQLRERMGDGLDEWFEGVEREGGVVCYDSGAELKVLFGFSSDAGNFVMAAVRCAMELSIAVERQALVRCVDVGVKVGVATGLVYSDGKRGGPVDWLVKGSELDFAVRLSRVAPVGAVVTCETTALVAQPDANVVELATIKARGARKVRTFLLRSVQSSAEALQATAPAHTIAADDLAERRATCLPLSSPQQGR